jgi:hypothetical protein
MPQLPEPRENAPAQTAPNGEEGMDQHHAPLEQPSPHSTPLEPAPPEPVLPEPALPEPALPEPTPLQPGHREKPSEERQMLDVNQPASQAQGEKS